VSQATAQLSSGTAGMPFWHSKRAINQPGGGGAAAPNQTPDI